jgi:hypothetical protein
MTGWMAAMMAAAACALACATTAAQGAQQATQPAPTQPAQTQQAQSPAQTQPAQAPAPAQTPTQQSAGSGYLGNIAGGGTGNPCNYATGYQLGVCNPHSETEQQYVQNPGGPAPGTQTNSQGCYYVKMDTGYCPSTGQYIPMQNPNH